jgi:formylmethanofuran dehydrogenase subunit E
MMEYAEVAGFHGHTCPGLAMGYRMATAAMKALGAQRSDDEELVAIVENDGCGTDAVQYISGCTFGKGNLLFRDYGKQVYTFFSRKSLRGVRVVFRPEGIPAAIRENRPAYAEHILTAPDEAILTVTAVAIPEPAPAKIRKTVNCAGCGEGVMESRLQEVDGKLLCIPCAGQVL